MKNLRIYQLIHRDLTGQLSQQEQKELDSYKTLSEYDYVFAELHTVWAASKEYFPKQKFDVEAAKARFTKRISESVPEKQAVIKDHPVIWQRVGVAAVIVLAIAALIYFTTRTHVESIEAKDDILYALLPDRSEVWLDQGAQLEIADFDQSTIRNVKLDGKAYFDVQSNTAKTFIVDLGDEVYIDVVGTAFSAESNREDRSYTVEVFEGVVRFYKASRPDLTGRLSAGQKGVLNPGSQLLVIEEHDGRVDFLSDKLSFKNTPLPEVFDKVSEYFQINISYDASDISHCLVNSPLMDEFGLEEIFDVLRGLYPDLSIKEAGNKRYEASGLVCLQ